MTHGSRTRSNEVYPVLVGGREGKGEGRKLCTLTSRTMPTTSCIPATMKGEGKEDCWVAASFCCAREVWEGGGRVIVPRLYGPPIETERKKAKTPRLCHQPRRAGKKGKGTHVCLARSTFPFPVANGTREKTATCAGLVGFFTDSGAGQQEKQRRKKKLLGGPASFPAGEGGRKVLSFSQTILGPEKGGGGKTPFPLPKGSSLSFPFLVALKSICPFGRGCDFVAFAIIWTIDDGGESPIGVSPFALRL